MRSNVRTNRATLDLLLVIVLALLPMAAAATPPDPTWSHGIYDEADGDHEVALVDDMVACKAAEPPSPLYLICLPEQLVNPAPPASATSRTLRRDRSPPAPVVSATYRLCGSAPWRTSTPVSVAWVTSEFKKFLSIHSADAPMPLRLASTPFLVFAPSRSSASLGQLWPFLPCHLHDLPVESFATGRRPQPSNGCTSHTRERGEPTMT